MKKFILPFCGIFLIASAAFAQPMKVVVDQFGGRELTNPVFQRTNSVNKRLEATGPLSLPFFDQFSSPNPSAFYNQWDSSGVEVVSLTNAPSAKVVEFNGLKRGKVHYDIDSGKSVKSDTLVSKIIDMAGKDASGKTVLTFSWQGGGNSQAPDSVRGDAFVVYVMNDSLNWTKIWTAPYKIDRTVFYNERIPLDKPQFFHSGFRLKFERTGISDADTGQVFLASVQLNTVLGLPFWEDFSQASTFPTHFKPNTGVYINNHLPVGPPSANVATFDGLNDFGMPYYNSTVFQMGLADSLVSLEINLDSNTLGISREDSLRFSFFYQIGGHGERPDLSEGDSLVLFGYNKYGQWKSMWHSNFTEATDTTKFYQVLLTIKDSSLFHPNFRFKFMNYARLSGSFDLWHLDYIAIDTIKSANSHGTIIGKKWFHPDRTISDNPSPLTAPYLSVPYHHLQSFGFKSDFNYTRWYLGNKAQNASSNYIISVESSSGTSTISAFSQSIKTLDSLQRDTVVQTFDGNSLVIPSEKFVLKHSVFLGGDTSTPVPGGYNYRYNDTATTFTSYDNYYAYDDGTYEYALMVEQERGKMAVLYTMYADDTLSHIDISFPKISFNTENARFFLKVWNDIGGKPGKELYSSYEQVHYTDGRNPFTRYEIKKKALVFRKDERYYIGYLQLNGNAKALKVGFDSNNRNGDKYWVDNTRGGGFSQFLNPNGSLMIRPVFKDGAPNPPPPPDPSAKFELSIYPNPNTGILYLNATFDKVEINDFWRGRKLTTESVDTIDLSNLEPGIYYVTAYLNGSAWTKKLIYQP